MFVLTEQIMNGTVTIATDSHLIDVPTFEEAVKFIQDRAATQGLKLINETTSEDGWWYGVEQPTFEEKGVVVLPCMGHIPRQPIETLK